jgi:hypothetical protein
MSSTRWTDAHDRLLSDSAPDAIPVGDADIERVWNRVAGGPDTTPPRRRRLRRRWVVAVAVVLTTVAGTSGLAAGGVFSAHTGQGPSDAEDLRLGGPGEKLDTAASDFGAIVAEATADIPFPTSAARRIAPRHQVDDAQRHRPAPRTESVSTAAIRAWVADAAICAWSNQWALATRTGDAAARAESITTIQRAPGWAAVTAVDPHPYSRMDYYSSDDTGEQYLDTSQFYYLGPLGQAVKGNDLGEVAKLLAKNN